MREADTSGDFAGVNSNVTRVLWLPAHPTAGSVSMLRHWQELDRIFNAAPFPGLEITCPLGAPPDSARVAGRLRRAWEKYVVYPRRVRRAEKADVIHILDHAFAHLLSFAPHGSRKIVTVHDLAPLEDGTLTPAQLRRFRRTLAWLNHADLLLSDSAFTAATLRSFLSSERQINVLLLGVDAQSFAKRRALPSSLVLPVMPRLFSIGSSLPRKNLDLLPAVLDLVVRDAGQVALVRVGSPLPQELRAKIQAIITPQCLIELGQVSDADLISIYQACDALIFPSTLEGFGLPVAEAMASGCPVVSSNASSLPEVGGDAALYFDPTDACTAAAHIVRILRDPVLRAELITRGTHRAQVIDWKNHAAALAAIYHR